MKQSLLITLSVLFLNSPPLFACSYSNGSFCATVDYRKTDVVLMGKIVSSDSNGIKLKVIDVLKGTETRTEIRVWDGTDFDCNGTVSMQASELGSLLDYIVIVLPKISNIENSWDVVGDYRRPGYLQYTPKLVLKNGILKGLIAGDDWATVGNRFVRNALMETDYEKFKSAWQTHSTCGGILSSLSTPTLKNDFTFQNPITSNISLNFDELTPSEKTIEVYNSNGSKISSGKYYTNTISIDMSAQSNGIYFVRMFAKNEQYEPIRIVKQ